MGATRWCLRWWIMFDVYFKQVMVGGWQDLSHKAMTHFKQVQGESWDYTNFLRIIQTIRFVEEESKVHVTMLATIFLNTYTLHLCVDDII